MFLTLVVVYYPFNISLNSFCYFVKNFCIYVHKRYWSLAYFFVIPSFPVSVMLASQNELRVLMF